jgi:uroporphyrinogen-III synthase
VRVIITRPVDQATPWLEAMRSAGFDAQALPLIDITHTSDTQALQDMRDKLHMFDACMLISANAAHYFFEDKTCFNQQNRAWAATELIAANSTTRFWATGAGTVQALLAQGVDAARIDAPGDDAAQWDSESLWARVQHQVHAGSQVLIVRGEDMGTPSASRDWLADQLRARGAVVHMVAAYQRRTPVWNADQLAVARSAAQDGSVWVFSSSQAVTHLLQLDPRLNLQQARCVATHPRIAQAARAAGFAVVCTSRPALADVVASIKSLS